MKKRIGMVILITLLFCLGISLYLGMNIQGQLLSNDLKINSLTFEGVGKHNLNSIELVNSTKMVLNNENNNSITFDLPYDWNTTNIKVKLLDYVRNGNVVINSSSMNMFTYEKTNVSYLNGQHLSENDGIIQFQMNPNQYYVDLWGNDSNNGKDNIDFQYGMNSTDNTWGILGNNDGWDWSNDTFETSLNPSLMSIYHLDPNGISGYETDDESNRIGIIMNLTSATSSRIIASAAFGLKFYVPYTPKTTVVSFDYEAFDISQAGVFTRHSCYIKSQVINITNENYLGYQLDNTSSVNIQNDSINEILWDYSVGIGSVAWHDDTSNGDFDLDGNGFYNNGTFTQDISTFVAAPGWYYFVLGTMINWNNTWFKQASLGMKAYFNNISIKITEDDINIFTKFNQSINLTHIPDIPSTLTVGTLSCKIKGSSNIPNDPTYEVGAWINDKYIKIRDFPSIGTSFADCELSLDNTFLSYLEQSEINLSIGVVFDDYLASFPIFNISIDDIMLNFTDRTFQEYSCNGSNFTGLDDEIIFSDSFKLADTMTLNFSSSISNILTNYSIGLELNRTNISTSVWFSASGDNVNWTVNYTTDGSSLFYSNFTITEYDLNISKPSGWSWRSVSPIRTVTEKSTTILIRNVDNNSEYVIIFQSNSLTELSINNIILNKRSLTEAGSISMTIEVVNLGEYDISGVMLSIYLDNELSPLENKTFNISASSTKNIYFSYQFLNGITGEHKFYLVLDSLSIVPEPNENNEFFSLSFSITPFVQDPTLFIIILSVVISSIGGGSIGIFIIYRRRTRREIERDYSDKKTMMINNFDILTKVTENLLNLCESLLREELPKVVTVYETLSENKRVLELKLRDYGFHKPLEEWIRFLQQYKSEQALDYKFIFRILYPILTVLESLRQLIQNQVVVMFDTLRKDEIREHQNLSNKIISRLDDLKESYARKVLSFVIIIYKISGTAMLAVPLDPKITVDPDLISGFITAITSFGHEVAKEDTVMNRMVYRNFVIEIEDGKHIRIALFMKGEANQAVSQNLRELVFQFERKYGKELENFLGNVGIFNQAKPLVKKILVNE